MNPHQSSSLFGRTCRCVMALVCLSVPFGSTAEVTVVDAVQCAVPDRNVEVVDNSITVSYTFPEIREVTVPADSSLVYHSIPGFGQCNEAGKPMLPMRIDTFRVPYGYEVSIAVANGDSRSVSCRYAGAAEALTDSSGESPLLTEASPYEGVFPAATGSILSTYTLRGETLAEVVVSPMQYDYESGTATINGSVTYTLTFSPMEAVLSTDSDRGGIAYSDRHLSEFLANSLVVNPNKIGGASLADTDGFEGSVGYIIVTTDEYLDAVRNFERWKNILGYTTHIISRPKWSSGSEVLAAIRECRRMNDDIQYLIIFGDNDDVPSMTSNRYKEHLTDSYFGTMPNSGFIPDIYIGRVPVGGIGEANAVINKIVRAEMCPVEEEDFYRNAIHCAKFDIGKNGRNIEDRRFVLTSEEIRNYVYTKGINAHRFYSADGIANPQFFSNYYSFGQAIPAELQRPSFPWSCSSMDIVDKFNEGCFYAFYRGHGTVSGWAGVGLYSSSLSKLSNDELFPTVFSITCLTGKFDDNCFAEQLLRKRDAGASSVIAASEVSYSGYNDSLIEGMMDAIWPNPGLLPRFNIPQIGNVTQTPAIVKRLGHILEQGLFRMNEQWGTYSKNTSLYQYEVFHLFGDPSMYFFTEKPIDFSDVEIVRDETGIHVSTNGELASISFFNQATGTAYKYETDEIFFPTDDQKNTIVCLTGYNHRTYLNGIQTPIAEEPELSPAIIRCTSKNNAVASVKVFPGNISRNITVSISDITGRHICSTSLQTDMNAADLELPLAEAGGVYVVSLCVDGTVVDTKKIIK